MKEIEIEKTFLAKFLPEGLKTFPSFEMLDIYLETDSLLSTIRLRKKGDAREITKKSLIDPNDFSRYDEQTIPLTQFEFDTFAQLPGKRLRKVRYQYPYQQFQAEIDVFQEALAGLVLVDIEVKDQAMFEHIGLPEFCLADVTQEKVIAGHNLAGKQFAAIATELEKYHYQPIVS